jgi:hypothetical protein
MKERTHVLNSKSGLNSEYSTCHNHNDEKKEEDIQSDELKKKKNYYLGFIDYESVISQQKRYSLILESGLIKR